MLLWQKYSSINMDDFLRSIEAVTPAIIEKKRYSICAIRIYYWFPKGSHRNIKLPCTGMENA